jgi:radical SAM protein (TIGR04043 family)
MLGIDASNSELHGELQAYGVRWSAKLGVGLSRVGGAGPSDHKAIQLAGHTLMVPVFTRSAQVSPFQVEPLGSSSEDRNEAEGLLTRDGVPIARVRFPAVPKFYGLTTDSGIPYFKIATLHSDKVLATTVLQNCVRFAKRETSCQFCAIGQSLSGHRTIPRKTPEQLAEVAEAAVRLDSVEHMVLTTGTPPTPDRGAQILEESARAIRERVDLPLQAQCEPPEDFAWFGRLKRAGVDTLGMHLEAVTEEVRRRIMPGKSEVSRARYYEAFESAVSVFGRGQVTTYILAGLGDSADAIVLATRELARLGVYSFVVPFVPISGTPLADHPPPSAAFMNELLDRVALELGAAGLRSQEIHAGCGRCGACSTLRSRERA